MKNDFSEDTFFDERPIIDYDIAEDNKILAKAQEIYEQGECTCEYWDIDVCPIHADEDEIDEFGNYFIDE